MLTTCSEPGCTTLVMGGRCIEHDHPASRVFVRGRPLTRATQLSTASYGVTPSGRPLRTVDARRDAPLGLAPSRS
jgi:hypothetical protein